MKNLSFKTSVMLTMCRLVQDCLVLRMKVPRFQKMLLLFTNEQGEISQRLEFSAKLLWKLEMSNEKIMPHISKIT